MGGVKGAEALGDQIVDPVPEQRAGVNKEELKKELERQRERLTRENPKELARLLRLRTRFLGRMSP